MIDKRCIICYDMFMENIQHKNQLPQPHPWVQTESAGNPELLNLLMKREDLIDTMADRDNFDTDRDIAASMLQEIHSIIVMTKNSLEIETIPPLPDLA